MSLYPPENEDLQNAIAAEGAVISEQPMGTEPQARHFPRRNRMISGLSLGVLVVEAASRSGSLITARTALEQGREVFAVPGSPLDPRAQGTNHLLRQGATLAERADDIAGAIAAMRNTPHTPLKEPEAALFEEPERSASDEISPEEGRAQIIELVSPAPLAIDDLVRLSGLTPGTVMTILLELEIAGLVQRHPGNQVSAL
jgi:DNA processing protein